MHLPIISQYPIKMKSSFFNNNNTNNNHSEKALQPRSRDPFDFDSLKSELPPNTGPPGTVSTNGNTSNSKNLSHVPCKFFKQGVCQAGNSCPFLHNLEGSLGADKLPCKYFQKGNCKFGLKCALAHFYLMVLELILRQFKVIERIVITITITTVTITATILLLLLLIVLMLITFKITMDMVLVRGFWICFSNC